ncbi:D-alanyl-lipoteichoic acid biosynthesis protein DltD [Bombilactobacillus thymidiniphilus]|uniref:Protein DltD n=1 Tax=Bombilactobacillus thymidiniphilus TaxID=2923363 RepID=A0ABY4PEF9_9LACO|nr:D-alanyl-lipoteichoic acid biosynthesis protein DltD [Bombilactobacillus thymidiniphilus]UQS83889.1 D-alanyl-lipoteichoic acid biosynthesis protein DltD [Bombilactobacillus thymidiniphilus]
MLNFKKLLAVLAPALTAAILAIVVLYGPLRLTAPSSMTVQKAATSLSPNILRGNQIKKQALDDGYTLVIGSSELSRFDNFHPSVLTQKYQRGYQPFLLGSPGTQSLTHFFSLQALGNDLDNKKVVVILSPQWFDQKGVKPAMFDHYYSKQQAIYFLRHANANSMASRYAASRLLAMPSGSADNNIKLDLENIKKYQSLSTTQKLFLDKVSRPNAEHQDQLFSSLFLPDRRSEIVAQEKVLPAKYDYQKLQTMATTLGKEHSTNNDFRIDDHFFDHQLKHSVGSLKGRQVGKSYEYGPEYADFQLLLQVFKQHNVKPLFIIPPVNSQWMAYTGLRQSMLDNFNQKITYQLRSQGFNQIADFHKQGDVPYFMEDTIHLGWQGWVATDRSISRFSEQKIAQPHYRLNDYFYKSAWCNRNPQTIPTLSK